MVCANARSTMRVRRAVSVRGSVASVIGVLGGVQRTPRIVEGRALSQGEEF
jgi:hypothetical protein